MNSTALNARTTRFRRCLATLFAAVALLAPLTAVGVTYAQPPAPPAGEAELPKTCNPKTEFCSPFHNADEEGKPDAMTQPARTSDRGNKVIVTYIEPAVAAVSALAGIIIAGSIIFAAIQYITAGGDSGKVSAAKQRILKAVILLVVYIFFYAFMRWLLPGAGL